MEIVIGGIVVFVAACLVYAAIALFFPEWVGITGKVALNAERSHRHETPPDSSQV